MLIPILLFVVGLVLLIKGGDWFVDGATGVANRFHVPEILIGATVVAIGTTLPEVMVSATSAAQGISGIAYGNAIGSIICNTALITAITIAVRPAAIDRKSLIAPVAFFFTAAAFYTGMAYINEGFTRWSGFVLLAIFVIYIAYSVVTAMKGNKQGEVAEEETAESTEKSSLWKEILLLVVGAAFIAIGAKLLVDNGTIIAQKLGVPDSVIALTVVALGTSLPELVTAITALAKGHSALSLGNIVGANLFNLVLVSGLATAIAPFQLPVEKQINGMNASLVVDTPVMLFVMAFLTVPALIRGKLSRFQGIVLLAVYVAFCVFQFAF